MELVRYQSFWAGILFWGNEWLVYATKRWCSRNHKEIFERESYDLTLFAVFTSLCGVYEQMLPFLWCSKVSCVALFRSRATYVHT